MSDKSSKKDKTLNVTHERNDDLLPVIKRKPFMESKRTIRRVSPLGMRVVVRITADNNMSEGGLYLPEGAKQNMSESLLAEVIEVASAHDSNTDEESNISGIPLGAHVLIPKEAGVKIPWDDSLRIVETKEVLAVVDEMSLS